MKLVIAPLLVALALFAAAPPAHAEAAPDSVALVKMLEDFLAGASRSEAAAHDRFWAEDLVYTGSSGRRIGKADIMKDAHDTQPPKPGEPITAYGAEQIRVRQFGETAVVTFRLVATTKEKDATHVARYWNSGTFVKRAGKWGVVCWQATRIDPTEDEAHREVAMAETAFRQALRVGEAAAIEALTEPGFMWTRAGGSATTREQLLHTLRANGGRPVLPDADSIAIAVYGETAIARGVVEKKPSGLHPTRDAAAPGSDFDVAYALTLLWRGGAWRAVSFETLADEERAASR